jgi:hypothetical protein
MKFPLRRNRPRWRAHEARVARPGLWLMSLALVAMLLVEVGQSSRMAELSLELDQNRVALAQAQARMEFVQAQLERRTTRAELAPQASKLGLTPADPRQVVALPAEFLAVDAAPEGSPVEASLLGLAERAARALVPEATARVRAGN